MNFRPIPPPHTHRIACVSCPTLFSKLLEIKSSDVEVIILEYDRRFDIYGDLFCFYDYNQPLNLPRKLEEHSFGVVVADPPFLSEECLRKTAETVKYLAREKIILCTGEKSNTSILYSGKLSKKTFMNFVDQGRFCGESTSFSAKSYISSIRESFLPWKFNAIHDNYYY